MEIRNLTLEEWNSLLPDRGFDVFHTAAALDVLDEYATGDLQLLGGFRGQEPVGLFPYFVREEWGVRFVLSPPPGLSVPFLGPLLMPTSPKRRKQEKLNERFIQGTLAEIDAEEPRTLFGMGGCLDYTDPRPYLWEELNVAPRFSYVLDVDGRDQDELLRSFTSDLRSEIRKREELDVTIDTEGPAQAERVCRNLKQRHAEQGLTYPTPESFSGDLVESLGDNGRVYVARSPDGEFLSGITVLYSKDKAMFWQGGTKANYENVSVNSLIHWKILEDIIEDSALESIERYDLGAVNNRRISRFKSKFNPGLAPYYEVKSALMVVGKKGYSLQRHLFGRLENLKPENNARLPIIGRG